MNEMNEFVLFYVSGGYEYPYDGWFGVRQAMQALPSGAAPCAVIKNKEVLWVVGWTSVSFPNGKTVDKAIASFLDFQGNYLRWKMREVPYREAFTRHAKGWIEYIDQEQLDARMGRWADKVWLAEEALGPEVCAKLLAWAQSTNKD